MGKKKKGKQPKTEGESSQGAQDQPSQSRQEDQPQKQQQSRQPSDEPSQAPQQQHRQQQHQQQQQTERSQQQEAGEQTWQQPQQGKKGRKNQQSHEAQQQKKQPHQSDQQQGQHSQQLQQQMQQPHMPGLQQGEQSKGRGKGVGRGQSPTVGKEFTPPPQQSYQQQPQRQPAWQGQQSPQQQQHMQPTWQGQPPQQQQQMQPTWQGQQPPQQQQHMQPARQGQQPPQQQQHMQPAWQGQQPPQQQQQMQPAWQGQQPPQQQQHMQPAWLGQQPPQQQQHMQPARQSQQPPQQQQHMQPAWQGQQPPQQQQQMQPAWQGQQPPQQQQQMPGSQQWEQPKGRGKGTGRGQSSQSPNVGKEFAPPQQQMQQAQMPERHQWEQSRGRGEGGRRGGRRGWGQSSQSPTVEKEFTPPPQQAQMHERQQWEQSKGRGDGGGGRGKGWAQSGQSPTIEKEFTPPPGLQMQPQQQHRGRDTPREPPPASGGRGQAGRETDRRIREVTTGMQQASISSDTQITSPRPITGSGDAPSHLLPQTASDARRGGKDGKFVTRVITNFFPLNIGKVETAIHYDVAVEPDKPRKLLRTVVEEFRRKMYPKRYPAYDGNKNLYSSSPLFESSEISGTVKVMDDDREKEYKVTVKFATHVDLTCLRNYTQNVRGRSALDLDKPMQALQCVDIVLRSAPSLSCIPVGRSFFTRPNEPFKLGDGAVLYNGFFQAAILGWKPFVNVDVANKAFPAAMNMIDLVREMCGDDLNSELQRYPMENLNKHIKTLKVQYELPRNQASRRVYRVNELGPPSNRASFKEDSGRTMTVAEYFRTKKNIPLRYPNLPTLWVGSRNRENKILLPLEFCTILPDQVVNKKMTEEQTRNMIRRAATDTRTRLQNISRSVERADYNGNPTMREFGISVNPTPQEVEARILHPPMLEYNNKRENVTKGVWRASQFIQGASLGSWTVLCLDRRTREDSIRRLESELIKTSKTLGMNISQPAQCTMITQDRNLRNDLRNYFAANKGFQMIVVILNNRSDCYNMVKEASEIAVGCLTQCLKSNTVYKLSASTVGNILLKINAKLNGENHHLQGLKTFLVRPCMIMGADVTHPGPDSKDFPSVAAVTASFDAHFFKYAFQWRLQPARQEMIEDLQEITREHLLNFYRKNNSMKPEKLIYVRDGVSDGQFEQVLNVELRAIRTACVRLEPNYNPPIVFVVVQKRHHTRFFPKDPRISEDRNCNVPAGTCVDTEITHPSIVDFYLVSHASIQGVAKPTKYVKLWDDCNMSEDDLEKLMYYLCHMFARCNRSVSYPAPTYYAHLAAARARVYCEIDRIDMRNLAKEQKRLTIKENITKNLPMFFV